MWSNYMQYVFSLSKKWGPHTKFQPLHCNSTYVYGSDRLLTLTFKVSQPTVYHLPVAGNMIALPKNLPASEPISYSNSLTYL